jgi:hypothetical protein
MCGPQHKANSESVVKIDPARAGVRGSRACVGWAKATEDTRESGAGVEEPPGVGEVERTESCRGNWRGPPWPWSKRRPGANLSITGTPGK